MTVDDVNVDELLHIGVMYALRTSCNNGNVFFGIFFGGNSGLLLDCARAVYEVDNAKDLDLMDRNKGSYLRNVVKSI